MPSLFDGELPVLNIGTDEGSSCAAGIEAALARVAEGSGYSGVVNGRFRGGYITRHYGAPEEHVHAVQLEIAQRAYMDEQSLRYDDAHAALLEGALADMLDTYLSAARSNRTCA